MRRYTTPTVTLWMPSLDFVGVSLFRVAFKCGKYLLIKTFSISDSAVDAENKKIVINLTQAETAAMSVGIVKVQARLKYNNGTVVSTDEGLFPMKEILDEVTM